MVVLHRQAASFAFATTRGAHEFRAPPQASTPPSAHVVEEGVQVVVVERVPLRQGGQVFLGQHVRLAVEGAAVGHVAAGHRPPPAGGHVGPGAVGEEAVVEGAGPGLHGGGVGLERRPLGVELEEGGDVLVDGAVLPGGGAVGAGEEVEAAVVVGDVVEGDPQADGVARRERPVGVVEVPAGGVGPGFLDQGLVVPDADAVHPGQLGGHLADPPVEHEAADPLVVHPQVDALGEDLVVVGVAGAPVAVGELAVLAGGDRGVDPAPPEGQFLFGEKTVDDDVPALAVVGDLIGGEVGLHRVAPARGVTLPR